ncbi:hypothetical protein AQ490_20270 [Wenjunlia vitaminophila]|uniref:Uncharacterized protein n=1 Tax=Wenjunlia vitaminophila TaxID=76728 RepID=A0A0T6LU58_WENVI|nr:hypothetical protein AQ490_20270 [Wenjunlia vitaminophila]
MPPDSRPFPAAEAPGTRSAVTPVPPRPAARWAAGRSPRRRGVPAGVPALFPGAAPVVNS